MLINIMNTVKLEYIKVAHCCRRSMTVHTLVFYVAINHWLLCFSTTIRHFFIINLYVALTMTLLFYELSYFHFVIKFKLLLWTNTLNKADISIIYENIHLCTICSNVSVDFFQFSSQNWSPIDDRKFTCTLTSYWF